MLRITFREDSEERLDIFILHAVRIGRAEEKCHFFLDNEKVMLSS